MRLIPRTRRRDPERSMSVIEHLSELRQRLLISIAAVFVGSIIGWVLYQPIFHFITTSYREACHALPKANQPPQGCDLLVATKVLEAFIIRVKLSLFTGLGVALPVLLFQLWRFITPGLKQSERRMAVPFVVSSLALFALGGWFAFLTLPRGLKFLLGFATGTVVPFITVGSYVSFVLLLTLAFGLSFEFPLLLIFLSWVRVVSSQRLRQWRRNAYLIIAVFAAVITPSQDPYTMIVMMVPMLVFYEVAIWVARALKR